MWFFREMFRLVWMIAVATAIAAAVAVVWALLSSGDFAHTMRISFLGFGCLLFLLATGGNRSTASGRRVNWAIMSGVTGNTIFGEWFTPREDEPTLTASAVFIGSGVVLIVLGLLV